MSNTPFEIQKFPGENGSSIHTDGDEEHLISMLKKAMDTGEVSDKIKDGFNQWLKTAHWQPLPAAPLVNNLNK